MSLPRALPILLGLFSNCFFSNFTVTLVNSVVHLSLLSTIHSLLSSPKLTQESSTSLSNRFLHHGHPNIIKDVKHTVGCFLFSRRYCVLMLSPDVQDEQQIAIPHDPYNEAD